MCGRNDDCQALENNFQEEVNTMTNAFFSPVTLSLWLQVKQVLACLDSHLRLM